MIPLAVEAFCLEERKGESTCYYRHLNEYYLICACFSHSSNSASIQNALHIVFRYLNHVDSSIIKARDAWSVMFRALTGRQMLESTMPLVRQNCPDT